MENQHQKITGYRDLTPEEIALMNEIKALGTAFETLLGKVHTHVELQKKAAIDNDIEGERLGNAQPDRWLSIGMTDMQRGLMAVTRAVAQPTTF